MAAISETLRQARLRSGIDLERLADKTKINPRYLQAIEAGDFSKLPSGIFGRMFVKQYAEAVGLDGNSVAEEYQRITSFGEDYAPDVNSIAGTRHIYQPNVPGLNAVGDRVRSERLASMLSSFMWVVAAILVCSAAYYGLAHLPTRERAQASPQAAPAPAPAKTPAAKVATPSTPAGGTPTAATPAAAPAIPGTPIQLEIAVTEPVWVTATADGKTAFSKMLNPGTNEVVSANDSAKLVLGNAGGAEITYNGKKLEPFGPRGQVRTIEFTPQGFQVVSRTSPTGDSPPNPDPLR